MATYNYYLKHRETGEIVELGPTAELTEELAKAHDITPDTVWQTWELCTRKE
jgi:hypothetical protein